MSDKVEIRTELLLAGVAKIEADLRDVRSRFDDVDKGREKSQSGFGSWVSTLHDVTAVLGTNLSSIADRVKQLGGEFIDAGKGAEAGDVAIATMIRTAQGAPLDEAIKKAQGLGDTFDEMSVRIGISNEALGRAFQTITERGDVSNQSIGEGVARLQDMAQIASKLGVPVEGLANEYSLMGEGMLRTKGRLFQLLQTTGIFGDDTRKAAAAWGQLTDEKRTELLRYGLDKIGSQVAKMPTYFGDASEAFTSVIRMSKEKVGEPIVKELTPALQELAQQVYEMGPTLEELGSTLAHEVGAGVREGGRLFKEALFWLRDHKTEIAADLRRAAEVVRDAFAFVLAHKEEIAVAFGAKAAFGPGKALLSGGASVGGAVYEAGKLGAGGGVSIGGLSAGAAGGAAGGAVALAAFSAAIAGVGLAAWQASKLIEEQRDALDTEMQGLKTINDLANAGDVDQVERAVHTARNLAEVSGRQLSPALDRFYASALRSAKIVKETGDIDAAAQIRKQIGMSQNALRDLGHAAELSGTTTEQQAANQAAILANAYNRATREGNAAMALLAAQTLASNDLVKQAFLSATSDVEGGFAQMADVLAQGGGQFAGFAAQLKGKVAQPPAPKISMPGARITVQQDFRKANPDNVALLFKRDLARGVERRVGARYAGVFGS